MSDFQTISFRVTPVLMMQIDRAAADHGMTRSDWLRRLAIDQLNEETERAELKAMEKRLLSRLEEMQQALTRHVTAEIDTLTSS